jgi:hypothetical protein
MSAARVRFESVIEWAVAAAVIAALFALGSFAVREFRTVGAATPVIARETSPAPPIPAGIPPRVVSVPFLLLSDGNEIRVGDAASRVSARLGARAEVGSPVIERAPHGQRLTRFYEHAGRRFVLVCEPFTDGAEPRVAAIYLQ